MSVVLVGAATLLPSGAELSERIPPRWCLNCGGMWLADAISNLLLFVPFGLALASRGRGVARIACSGVVLSVAVELCQSVGIPPGRSPAIADILANTLGAASGWILWRFWRQFFLADQHRSGILAGLWWVMAASASALTAAAEQSEYSGTPTSVRPSSFQYAPGYGWYGGTPIVARVFAANGSGPWIISHVGSGPIVAESDRGSPDWRIGLRSSGRDSVSIRRAMFLLHVQGDTTAQLLIAQHGGGVDLVVRRRAWAWGLSFPVIAVPRVFAEQSPSDTVLIHALVTNRLMQLEAMSGVRSEHVQFALTPAIGWAMLQTIVGVQDSLAPAIQLLWLGALFFPLAWWSGRTKRTEFAILSATGVVVLLVVVAPAMGVSPFSLKDAVCVVGLWTAGTTLGWQLTPRYSKAL